MADATIVSAGPMARIDGIRGVVHAVFPTALYVEISDSPMLVVHGPAHGHTPTSLIVDRVPPGGWGAAAGDAVAGGLGHLRLGTTLLDGRHARAWQPRRPARSGIAAAAPALPAIEAAATAALAGACRRLTQALAAEDVRAIDASVGALVGFGPGLTPAGDDALVGLLALLHRGAAPAAGAATLHRLAASLGARLAHTTAISAHYLRLALAGHFSEALSDLVDGFAGEALARVRAIGASSGADALAGVAAGLRMLRDLEATLQLEEAA